MHSPYEGLPPRNYWRTGVAEQHPLTVQDLWRPKFPIEATTRIATAGSCFAQHIARYLRERNYAVIDAEPAPRGLEAATAKEFGYGLYSARYGNIYVVRQLLQLINESLGRFRPEDAVWEKNGRFFDALRPSVEPNGLASPELVALHRAQHLQRVREVFESADLLVFTLGLTESWVHTASGTAFPTAPGTIAGRFDPARHAFKNFTFREIHEDFLEARRLLKELRPGMRFLLTVSPVPLTATATGNHVLPATVYSKSVLRGVAGQLADECEDVDYFPSYEIIASHFSKGFFYEPNLRTVGDAGVQAVMRVFFSQQAAPTPAEPTQPRKVPPTKDDVVCEEALLEAFAK